MNRITDFVFLCRNNQDFILPKLQFLVKDKDRVYYTYNPIKKCFILNIDQENKNIYSLDIEKSTWLVLVIYENQTFSIIPEEEFFRIQKQNFTEKALS
jgi:hypothetical protein